MSTSGVAYTKTEDRALKDYVVKNGLLGKIKGVAIWKRMEENREPLENRTWQSMKNRFLKSIHLSKKEIERSPASPAKIFTDVSRAYQREEDVAILEYILANKRLSDVKGNALWVLMENRRVTQRSYQSMKERFRKVISKNIDEYGDVVRYADREKIKGLWP